MPHLKNILETALYVSDMQRSIEFYQSVLGLEKLSGSERLTTMRIAENQVLLLFRKGGSVKDTITDYGVVPHTDGDGELHLCFGVTKTDFAEWEKTLAEKNITIESKLAWPAGGESLYFRDPDGHILELKTTDWNSPVEFE